MRAGYILISLLVTNVLLSVPANASVGATAEDHPLYKIIGQGEIVQSWTFDKKDGRMNWPTSGYFVRYDQHTWAPLEDKTSTKFADLDYFISHSDTSDNANFITINFQRTAKVYLLVHAWQGSNPAMRGWTPEGWVTKVSGPRDTILGISTAKRNMYAPSRAFAFSKVAKSVTIGTHVNVRKSISGLTDAKGYWSLLVAEESGKPVSKPKNPPGYIVEANKYCPPELHDEWVTSARDTTDSDMIGQDGKVIKFRTHHPLWDPLYFCAYDHEHGSNAKKLMGYQPMYGYTARKNGNENESHRGFKDIVLDTPKYWIYYSIHAHMAFPRRFSTRFHTKTIAAVNKKTGELELELTFKADYGHREVRLANRDRAPVAAADEMLLKETGDYPHPRRLRTINLINGADRGRLDKRYLYRSGNDFIHGEYEQWSTQPMCSKVKRWGEPTVDFRNMALAMKTASGGTTLLGRFRDGKFVPQTSQNRQFRAENFRLSDKFCIFPLPYIFGTQKNGKFYTDVYGSKLYSSPGPDRVAQFIKEGFAYEITGEFDTEETWDGLYIKGGDGSFKDIGNSLLYDKN